jgi:hypothetical protein
MTKASDKAAGSKLQVPDSNMAIHAKASANVKVEEASLRFSFKL